MRALLCNEVVMRKSVPILILWLGFSVSAQAYSCDTVRSAVQGYSVDTISQVAARASASQRRQALQCLRGYPDLQNKVAPFTRGRHGRR